MLSICSKVNLNQQQLMKWSLEKSEKHVGVWISTESFEKGHAINAQGVVKQQLPSAEGALTLGVREDAQISFSPSILLNRNLVLCDVVVA
ncbi:hypothetical protein OK016_17845 [Vibrio chagasii]|nr:hypothetical protein [Vibrio chagasii]